MFEYIEFGLPESSLELIDVCIVYLLLIGVLLAIGMPNEKDNS